MIALLLLASCAAGPPPAATPLVPTGPPEASAGWRGPTVLASARLVAVGDLLMHTNVKNSATAASDPPGTSTPAGFAALFEHVGEWVASADVAFANLETPVAPKSDRGTRSLVFNVSPDLLPALEQVGFDVLSFANNHVYDQGRDGFVETLAQLRGTQMTWLGAGDTCAEARSARIVEAKGLKIAFIGASRVYNENLNIGDDAPCSFALDLDQALAEARAARALGADFVVLSVHWGREYRTAPEPEEVADAHRLMDGGVDLVLGHHPHVVQPVEVYETPDGRIAVTAYSLGNFISNQRYDYRFGVHSDASGNPRDGLGLQLDLVKKDYGPGPDGQPQVRTELANLVAVPLWTDNDAGRISHPAPRIRVVRIDHALREAQAALAQAESADAAFALKRRIELLEARWEAVEGIVGGVMVVGR